ncbi:MAG: hypothetical protein IJU31_03325 [Synergistaceae bacterium]|nr:hypothetical protein [Synergistaceae bacterium]
MFSLNFGKIRDYVMKFIKPSLYLGGFDYFMRLWKDADAKDRGILILMFTPMFFCFVGFIFSIIYFVLFVLPSYLFTFIGWALLTALFGAGGKYFYAHLTNREMPDRATPDFIDVEVVVGETAKEEKEKEKSERKSRRRTTVPTDEE